MLAKEPVYSVELAAQWPPLQGAEMTMLPAAS